MSKTSQLWIDTHEAAAERFMSGEDSKETFIVNLAALGFYGPEIIEQIELAESMMADAASDAGAAHYGRITQ